tara:strand:- start:336 stop:665 length:330 start_codon:yes stop_codon:yes gene_type:complete
MKMLCFAAVFGFVGAPIILIYPVKASPMSWDCGSLGTISVTSFTAPGQIVHLTASKLGIKSQKALTKGGANWLSVEGSTLSLFNGSRGKFANQVSAGQRFFDGSEVSCR